MAVQPCRHLLCGHDISKAFVVERWPIIGKPRKQFTALEKVSFHIDEGETVGIVGESGSGKSTLGEILGGLRTCTEGSVHYKAVKYRDMNRNQFRVFRRNVQFIFQTPRVQCTLLSYPHNWGALKTLKLCSDREEISSLVEEMLAQVGLDKDIADKYPGQLSGGQCQRVAIARALIVNPDHHMR